MNDLIKRQDAINVTWEEPTYSDPLNVLTEVRDKLKNLPSAEPEIIKGAGLLDDYIKKHPGVQIIAMSDLISRAETKEDGVPEIIRCKDCKHFNDGDCTELPKFVSEEDFCSFAEREKYE